MGSLIRPTRSEFCERRFDLLFARKAAFRGGAQATIDAGKLLRRRLAFAVLQAGIEFKCKLGELVLGVGWPCLDPLQNLCQFRCLHDADVTQLRVIVSALHGDGLEAALRADELIRALDDAHFLGPARGGALKHG
jgi:hypothetical protein